MIEYIDTEDFGKVRVSRRQGTRTMRILVSQNGEVKLSMPPKVATQVGLKFLQEKKHWILQNKKEQEYLDDGARIGSTFTLRVRPTSSTKSKTNFNGSSIVVDIPNDMQFEDVQKKLTQAAKKALQKTADSLLPQRLEQCAKNGNFIYKLTAIKPLTSRWGSCSSKNELMFNTYLMQLPWDLIDYVIFHELSHTIHHNHSSEFWQEVATHVPDYKKRRAALKKFPTSIFDMRNQNYSVS